mmetsp:Transcript_107089/g.190270  ORF Transcript_107089/g.190270 Transcript_107089/m.190270 type:complete len:120 (-) Transcript_107089:42-401(-)
MNGRTRDTLILASALGISLALIICACAFFGTWVPMTMLIPFAILPAPLLFLDVAKSTWLHLCFCIIGVLVSSLFGLPIVLLHLGNVSIPAMVMWLIANIISAAAVAYYLVRKGQHDDDM